MSSTKFRWAGVPLPVQFGRLALVAAFAAGSAPARATEGGGNSYPIGVDNLYSGLMLPEGANWLLFYQHYDAGSVKDNSGHDNPKLAHFHLRLNALAPRLSYVWPGVRVFGANLETRVVVPIVSADLDSAVARPPPLLPLDKSGNKTGLADMTLAPVILGWHSGSFHQLAGVEFHLKTGAYDVHDPVNVGRNYYQIAPTYAFTWFPTPKVDIGAKFRYGFNTRNEATNYQSGDEATIEFSAGYHVTPRLTLGLNGLSLTLALGGLLRPVSSTLISNGAAILASLNGLRPLLGDRLPQLNGNGNGHGGPVPLAQLAEDSGIGAA